ncbi:NAD(P)/FAD-dependent oxidoreductase [Paenibacillus tarimensis]
MTNYDCVIVGGGIAGLQAAIQLGRYNHHVAVLDDESGRSTLCRSYHNILGWPDGISGQVLRETGRRQAERLGVVFIRTRIVDAIRIDDRFELISEDGERYCGKRILLATGVVDRVPGFAELRPCLGLCVYICPDCDGYEVKNQRTIVLGSGKSGADMALALLYWTKDIVYVNHEMTAIDSERMDALHGNGITYIESAVRRALVDGDRLNGLELVNGDVVSGSKAFLAFGGNQVQSSLAAKLGVELLQNRHVAADARTKMTNIKHVWAAGDVVAHSEQLTIAMGEGSQAAIWMHKSLMNPS